MITWNELKLNKCNKNMKHSIVLISDTSDKYDQVNYKIFQTLFFFFFTSVIDKLHEYVQEIWRGIEGADDSAVFNPPLYILRKTWINQKQQPSAKGSGDYSTSPPPLSLSPLPTNSYLVDTHVSLCKCSFIFI